ncbi:hypothetical protein [Silicimonas sp. MF1-12-2]|uniref:hypothetical protein n=1 Tax=Silicimonas sp. MF1-12-2 TaxID=3384793 RepID=UPI0039B5DA3F
MTFADATATLPAGRAAPLAFNEHAAIRARRLAAALLLGQFVFMWGAFFVLAPSIQWPASLGLPAAEARCHGLGVRWRVRSCIAQDRLSTRSVALVAPVIGRQYRRGRSRRPPRRPE